MESRRDALKIMLVTAAVATTGATATVAEASMGVDRAHKRLAARPSAPSSGEGRDEAPPTALIQPLQPGDALGGTWKLAALTGLRAGAVVIELHDLEGQRARIHVCARQGDGFGLASTPRLDLLLMNGGNGRTTSNEHLGRVALGVAALVEQNERAAFAAHPELEGLMPHDQRLKTYQGSTALS